MQFVRMKIKR